MKTSYFAKYKEEDGVSIAGKSPEWFTGKSYPALFPKWSFYSKYKIDGDEKAYEEEYRRQVLDKLNPVKVYEDLEHAVILCWEGSGKFCHRRLVAQWLYEKLGVTVDEL